MGLYLNGRGSYSFGYTDDDGNPQWARVNPRQDAENMGLPKGVVKQLKELKSGRNKVFFETQEAPREYGYSGGAIDMSKFKDASEKTAKAYAPSEKEANEHNDSPESSQGPHVVVKEVTDGRASSLQGDEEIEVRPAYAPEVDEVTDRADLGEGATPRPGEWEPEVDPREAYERPVRDASERTVPRQQEWSDPTNRDGHQNMPEPKDLGDKADEVKKAEKAAAAEKAKAAEGDEKPKAKAKGKKSPKD